jgi:hypothetical protein
LSITHHTRKRPSIGPRTTHGPQKNAGATFQRAIQACFKKPLNKNVEAYVDDVVVKTQNSDMLIANLEETFASL